MALRRPPTRIELKNDDIDEYVEVSMRFEMRRPTCQRCDEQ
jgi:hypothetical protein